MRGFHFKRLGSWWAVVASVLGLCALPCLTACPGAGHRGSGGSRSAATAKSPTIQLRKFDGRRGVFRIHNDTGRTIRRIAVGLRGVGCEGPRATRTVVKVFDLRLRPGERQSFAFHFDHRCRRAHVAAATQ